MAHAITPGIVIGFIIAGMSVTSLLIGGLIAGVFVASLTTFLARKPFSEAMQAWLPVFNRIGCWHLYIVVGRFHDPPTELSIWLYSGH